MRKPFAHLLFLMLLSACSFLPSPGGGRSLPPAQPQVTITSIVLPPAPSRTPDLPTRTPTPTFQAAKTKVYQPTAAANPSATASPSAAATQTPALPPPAAATPARTVEAKETMPYAVQSGSPLYTASFNRPGCQWVGIAGQVFGDSLAPEKNLIVFASGQINGSSVNALGITGQALAYGDGGYEIQLSDAPAASSGKITVQLFDRSIQPLSEPFVLSTSGDCAKNLILLNFQSGASHTYSVAP